MFEGMSGWINCQYESNKMLGYSIAYISVHDLIFCAKDLSPLLEKGAIIYFTITCDQSRSANFGSEKKAFGFFLSTKNKNYPSRHKLNY